MLVNIVVHHLKRWQLTKNTQSNFYNISDTSRKLQCFAKKFEKIWKRTVNGMTLQNSWNTKT